MRRTSIELDEERFEEARRVLGTRGIKDTVERAFDEVIRAHLRRQLAEQIRSGEGIDRSEDILNASRRWDR